jgi:hypothetical protein
MSTIHAHKVLLPMPRSTANAAVFGDIIEYLLFTALINSFTPPHLIKSLSFPYILGNFLEVFVLNLE